MNCWVLALLSSGFCFQGMTEPTDAPKASTITVSPASSSILVGGTVQFSATVADADGLSRSGYAVVWSSRDPSVVVVDANGLATGMSQGSTEIVAASGSTSATAPVSVAELVDGWPSNEPPGMTRLVFGDGSDKYFDPNAGYGGKWDDNTYVSVVEDVGAKYGGRAIEKRLFAGDGSGWNGIAYDDNWSGAYREVYFRAVFKYSPNWEWHDAGEKLFYFGGEQIPAATDFYIAARGGSHAVQLRCQAGNGGDNCGIWISDRPITRGTYHTVELHMVAQSAPGTRDGAFTVWFDGERILQGSGLQFYSSAASSSLWDGYQAFLYWGGSGDTKTVNDWIRISEFYISGKQ